MSDKSPLDTISEVFQVLQDISDKLTIRRILTVLVVGLMLTALTMMYDNRATLFQTLYMKVTDDPEPKAGWAISDETQHQLNTFVTTVELVNFVTVVEVDLRRNTRWSRFVFFDDPEGPVIKKKLLDVLPQSMFDYDQKNTVQMTSVLQNEFTCVRFQDTNYQRFVPTLAKKVPIICRIAIPPFYNKFAGYIDVGLNQAPTKYELDSLRIEATRLAVEIYLRDVVKKPVGYPLN
jgi:hypothetical protein